MVCSRCGKCCQYELYGRINTCKYLIGNIGTFTTCSIYEYSDRIGRIGTVIDQERLDNRIVKKITCNLRKDANRYIIGCTELNMNNNLNTNPKIVIGISVFNSVHPNFLIPFENSRREWRRAKYLIDVAWDDRVPLDNSRNNIVKNAIRNNVDYILFLDSDIRLPVGTLTKLLIHDKDIVTGIYFWKAPSYYPVIMKKNDGRIDYTPIFDYDKSDNNNLIEIDSTGFGCCLVKVDVFKNLPYPWFKNESEVLEGDLYFCKLAQKHQYKLYADNTIICDHWGIFLTEDIRNKTKNGGGSLPDGEQPVELIKYLVDTFKPKTVLDVGCGPFGAMKIFKSLGVDTWGLDGDDKLTQRSDLEDHYRLHIIDLELSSYISAINFDMVFSYEVAEHILNVNNYVDTMTDNCKDILVMTHALPGQGGYNHVNEQYDDYWINRIKKKGFKYMECETKEARLINDKYFKQSGLLFKRI